MKITVELGERSYPVVVKRGVLERVGMLANLTGRVLVVSDDGVPARYVKTVLAQCGQGHVFTLPQGEQSKSVQNWEAIAGFLHSHGFAHGDMVVAVGGGMVGDVAGFAAACYRRGIAWCHVPTTTLAQADAAVGGKTALNLCGAKNVVGAFHQPSLVAIDPATLKTLPQRHHASGLAEALKVGLVGDCELFEILESEDISQNIERILYLSLRYKIELVQQDETDTGQRRMLNFGHTFGHAIEAASGLGPNGLLHGEAVALGMLPMIEGRALLRRTRAVMKKLGLPMKMPYDKDAVLQYIQNDKKRNGDAYTVVRVKTLGQGYLEKISFEELALLVKGDAE